MAKYAGVRHLIQIYSNYSLDIRHRCGKHRETTPNISSSAEVLEQVMRSEAIVLGSLQNVFKCTAPPGPPPHQFRLLQK